MDAAADRRSGAWRGGASGGAGLADAGVRHRPRWRRCATATCCGWRPAPAEIIDKVPFGRIYKDGKLIGDDEAMGIRDRRKLSFAGHVAVNVVLDEKYELAGDPDLVADRRRRASTRSGEDMEDLMLDAAIGAVDSIPRQRRKDLDLVQEAVRRAVRAAANDAWGKKPLVTVFVTSELAIGSRHGSEEAAGCTMALGIDRICRYCLLPTATAARTSDARPPQPCRHRCARSAAATAVYRDTLGASVSAPQALPEHGVTVVFVDTGNTKIELLEPLGEDSPIAAFLDEEPGRRHAPSLLRGGRHPGRARPAEGAGRARAGRRASRKIGAHGKPVLFLHPKDFSARWSNWNRPEPMSWISVFALYFIIWWTGAVRHPAVQPADAGRRRRRRCSAPFERAARAAYAARHAADDVVSLRSSAASSTCVTAVSGSASTTCRRSCPTS